MSPESNRNRIGAFFSGEYARMVAFVRNLIDDAAERDGEDIVQDVMERLVSAADFTVPVENLAAYIYQSLRNRVIDALRSRTARRESVSLDAPRGAEGDATLLDLLHDTRYDAAREAEKAEIREHFYAALDSLGAESRAIIVLTEFEGRSFREISEELGVPVGTLLARKSRAMQKIRESLNGLLTDMEAHNEH